MIVFIHYELSSLLDPVQRICVSLFVFDQNFVMTNKYIVAWLVHCTKHMMKKKRCEIEHIAL